MAESDDDVSETSFESCDLSVFSDDGSTVSARRGSSPGSLARSAVGISASLRSSSHSCRCPRILPAPLDETPPDRPASPASAKAVPDVSSALNAIASFPPGQAVPVRVMRRNQELNIDVQVGKRRPRVRAEE